MTKCPHVCNPEVAITVETDQDKGCQAGIQKTEVTQAGGRSEYQQLLDSFHRGEQLAKILIPCEGKVEKLPTVIVCEKLDKEYSASCECEEQETKMQRLPQTVQRACENEAKQKKARAMDCLQQKIKRLSSQIEHAREINKCLNEQMAALIQQQNSCPYSCDKPVRGSCPPKPTFPPPLCPGMGPQSPSEQPCPPQPQPSCPLQQSQPNCPNVQQKKSSSPPGKDKNTCPGPCGGTEGKDGDDDEIGQLISKLDTLLQCFSAKKQECPATSCPPAYPSNKPQSCPTSCNPNITQNANKMLQSCMGPCNVLRSDLDCHGPCNPPIEVDCLGPCSSRPVRGADCGGPCNLEGFKEKIESLSRATQQCDIMKKLIQQCYFNEDPSPTSMYRPSQGGSFKIGSQLACPNICNSSIQSKPKRECPAISMGPQCPPPSSSYKPGLSGSSTRNKPDTCPGVCNTKNVAEEVDTIQGRLQSLNDELTKAYKENEQIEAERLLLHCIKHPPEPIPPPCPAMSCPPQPCPSPPPPPSCPPSQPTPKHCPLEPPSCPAKKPAQKGFFQPTKGCGCGK